MNTKEKAEAFISTWESRCYPNGVPDEADSRLESLGKVPSYRRICLAIIRNDLNLTSLGYIRRPSKIYSTIKQIELKITLPLFDGI